MRQLLATIALMLCVAAAPAEIRLEPVEYLDGETQLEGWVAYDDAIEGKRPGVMIVHQWTGITAYEKRRASMLAELGYVAFVADIYGKGISPVPRSEAGQYAGKYKGDLPLLRSRVNSALETMKAQPRVDASQTAAIGYCFGGTAVLELARSGADVDGVVSFHGGLSTPAPQDAKNIKGKVLVLHGADDPAAPMSEVVGLVEEMEAAGVDYHLTLYGEARHSFTQPMAGNDKTQTSVYNEKADKRSWEHMKTFFNELFGE
ncbi:MAG: hypothetical protein PWP23_2265 [Candidatus Sumerlaeota bacterium]|nr:hypothetical protein [Candidatus Sumerlaeota bacterium]